MRSSAQRTATVVLLAAVFAPSAYLGVPGPALARDAAGSGDACSALFGKGCDTTLTLAGSLASRFGWQPRGLAHLLRPPRRAHELAKCIVDENLPPAACNDPALDRRRLPADARALG